MGTWSCPNTAEKAQQLAELMEVPILKRNAPDALYRLIGDDDLFDEINDSFYIDNDDIRLLVALKLEGFLSKLNSFVKPWEPRAIEICKGIIKKHELNT